MLKMQKNVKTSVLLIKINGPILVGLNVKNVQV